jgi:hypothetical protein
MTKKFKIRAGIALSSVLVGSILIGVSTEDIRTGALAAGIGLLLFGVAAMFALSGD